MKGLLFTAAVLAACSTPAGSGGARPAATHDGDSMTTPSTPTLDLDLLDELVRLLARDPLTVEEVAARVGTVLADPGPRQPMRLAPSLAGVSEAKLARSTSDGEPYALTLVPVAEARPTLGALAARFGPYWRTRSDRGRPREVVFAAVGAPRAVVILAEVPADAEVVDAARVSSVTLRRDRSPAPP